jgi:hypothetical protein
MKKRALGRRRREVGQGKEDNIKMNLIEIVCQERVRIVGCCKHGNEFSKSKKQEILRYLCKC